MHAFYFQYSFKTLCHPEYLPVAVGSSVICHCGVSYLAALCIYDGISVCWLLRLQWNLYFDHLKRERKRKQIKLDFLAVRQ